MAGNMKISEAAVPEDRNDLLQLAPGPDVVVGALLFPKGKDVLQDAPFKPFMSFVSECQRLDNEHFGLGRYFCQGQSSDRSPEYGPKGEVLDERRAGTPASSR